MDMRKICYVVIIGSTLWGCGDDPAESGLDPEFRGASSGSTDPTTTGLFDPSTGIAVPTTGADTGGRSSSSGWSGGLDEGGVDEGGVDGGGGGESGGAPNCITGPSSAAADWGPHLGPMLANECVDHLHVGDCGGFADADVLAIHDDQPMVEASVLNTVATWPITTQCDDIQGVKAQTAHAYGEADTRAANYSFTGSPGSSNTFSVSATNILGTVLPADANASLAVSLSIGAEYFYACACTPDPDISTCVPGTNTPSACFITETYLGNDLQSNDGITPNAYGGCTMLMGNPAFTVDNGISMSAAASATIDADNTNTKSLDNAAVRALISTSLIVKDSLGNDAGVTMLPSTVPVACGGQSSGDPPPGGNLDNVSTTQHYPCEDVCLIDVGNCGLPAFTNLCSY